MNMSFLLHKLNKARYSTMNSCVCVCGKEKRKESQLIVKNCKINKLKRHG